MTIYFDSEVENKLDLDIEDILSKCLDAVLDDAKCPYECEVSLLLVDNDSIREINNENRGIDNPTDVLSFPNNEFDTPGNFDLLEENGDAFDPDSGELILGDIVISQDKVISQAEEFGHSELRELAFLIVHSLLHLIGYDHIQEDDRVIMEEKQRIIMDALGIHR